MGCSEADCPVRSREDSCPSPPALRPSLCLRQENVYANCCCDLGGSFGLRNRAGQQSVPPPPQPAVDAPANAGGYEVVAVRSVGESDSACHFRNPRQVRYLCRCADRAQQAGASEAELSAILAQGAAPTYPPAAGAPITNGPTLEVTMKFIQDKLGEVGTVNFAGYVHDSADNTDGVQKFSSTTSDIVAIPALAPSVTIASSSITAEKNTTRMSSSTCATCKASRCCQTTRIGRCTL